MPEWDIPGHGSWGKGYPNIMVTDGPCDDTLDPTNPDTYTFLLNFLAEMGGYFPDQYLFLGGDEVSTVGGWVGVLWMLARLLAVKECCLVFLVYILAVWSGLNECVVNHLWKWKLKTRRCEIVRGCIGSRARYPFELLTFVVIENRHNRDVNSTGRIRLLHGITFGKWKNTPNLHLTINKQRYDTLIATLCTSVYLTINL